MIRILLRCLCAIVALGTLSDAAAAAQRTFVASYGQSGNVASNCALVMPCRAFSEALGVTAAGGEIVILDSAGYSPVTIAQAVTIVAPKGVYAGISSFSGNAITIDAPGAVVRLRGLTLNGLGGATGISVTNVGLLDVEDVRISGFSFRGIDVPAPGARVNVTDSTFVGNGDAGVHVQPGSGNATVTIARSHFHRNNSNGIVFSTNATGMIAYSDDAESGLGFLIDAAGIATIADCAMSYRLHTGQGILVRGAGTKAMIARCDISSPYQGVMIHNGAHAQITDSTVHGTTVGMSAEEDSNAVAVMDVERSTVIDSYRGFWSRAAFGSSLIRLSNSTTTLNSFGLEPYTGTSAITSRQNNTISGNSTDINPPGSLGAFSAK